MGLRVLTRKAKMNLTSLNVDICELLFAQARARHACRLFLTTLKSSGGLSRAELSRFADDLEHGKIEEGFKYSRRQFYAQIRRTLLTLGLMAIEERFVGVFSQDLTPERRFHRDVVEKYVPVAQPISKRPPDGLNLPRLVWNICKAWNDEFMMNS